MHEYFLHFDNMHGNHSIYICDVARISFQSRKDTLGWHSYTLKERTYCTYLRSVTCGAS